MACKCLRRQQLPRWCQTPGVPLFYTGAYLCYSLYTALNCFCSHFTSAIVPSALNSTVTASASRFRGSLQRDVVGKENSVWFCISSTCPVRHPDMFWQGYVPHLWLLFGSFASVLLQNVKPSSSIWEVWNQAAVPDESFWKTTKRPIPSENIVTSNKQQPLIIQNHSSSLI